jgi:hypothetical protein
MKMGSLNVVRRVVFLALVAAVSRADADTKVNPYEAIAARNPFHLKDPPPAPDPNDIPKGPPPVIPTVEVTGILNIFQKKQAFLEIVPSPGKPVVRVTLGEGEKGEAVEVVSIDLENNSVTLNNSGIVTNVALKTAAKSTGAPTPGGPGLLIPPGANPAYVPPQAASVYSGAAPNSNPSSRGNPMVVGGNSAATVPGATPVTTYGANPGIYTPAPPGSYNPGVNTSVNDLGGARQIPTRTIRQQTIQPDGPPVDPAVQYINMAVQEQQAKSKNLPFPPLPPIPGEHSSPPIPGEH